MTRPPDPSPDPWRWRLAGYLILLAALAATISSTILGAAVWLPIPGYMSYLLSASAASALLFLLIALALQPDLRAIDADRVLPLGASSALYGAVSLVGTAASVHLGRGVWDTLTFALLALWFWTGFVRGIRKRGNVVKLS